MWHYAFWEQAKSDWKAYGAIQSLSLDDCHSLHYLQIASVCPEIPVFEKI